MEKEQIKAFLTKIYDKMIDSEGGEGCMIIDGKEYYTDTGYALEGASIFLEIAEKAIDDGALNE